MGFHIKILSWALVPLPEVDLYNNHQGNGVCYNKLKFHRVWQCRVCPFCTPSDEFNLVLEYNLNLFEEK